VLATAGTIVLMGKTAARSAWRWAGIAALVATWLAAIPAQIDLWRIASDFPSWQQSATQRAQESMRTALDNAVVESQAAVDAALHAPPVRARAFNDIAGFGSAAYERGLVLSDGHAPFAWSGVIRVPLGPPRAPIEVVGNAVYLAIRTSRTEGTREASGVTLINAISPGDSLAQSLAQTVADRQGLSGFAITVADSRAAASPGSFIWKAANGPSLEITPILPGQDAVAFARRERARILVSAILAIAILATIVAVWRETSDLRPRLGALAAALVCAAIVPVNQYSNASRLFDPAVYFAPLGRQLTANAGALSITSALALLGLIAIVRARRRRRSRIWASAIVFIVVGAGPFLLRELARGIQIPARGVDAPLWLMWEIPIFLAGVVVLLAGASAGAIVLGRGRGLHPSLAPVLAAFAALIAPIVWQAPGQWPWWYTFLWIAAIAALALSRQTRYLILAASTVAALGSVTLVWGRSARGRVGLAEADLRGLTTVNQSAAPLLERFAQQVSADVAPATRLELLKTYVASDLAAAQFPVSLAAWSREQPTASFGTSMQLTVPVDSLRAVVRESQSLHHDVIRTVATDLAVVTVLAAPAADGGMTTVAVGPRSKLFSADPYARLLGIDPQEGADPPYTVQLRERIPVQQADTNARWRVDRPGSALHGDWDYITGQTAWRTHVEVELRPLGVLIQRGTLIVILDLVIVAVLWAVGVIADGRLGRWIRARRRRWLRSYRVRLSLALFAFFFIPAVTFAVWSYQQLATDARQARELLLSETLRAAAPADGSTWLPSEGRRLGTPLLLYVGGELSAASDSLLGTLAPFGRMVDPGVWEALAENDEGTASREQDLGDDVTVLIGFRPLTGGGAREILAAPARADELSQGRRRRDLGILVLFATVIGGIATFWLSGLAARQLANPIRNLREAALSIGGGERVPLLEPNPTVEFQPVFTAFRRMATDLNASRTALEDAQRRTAAVLRNVASGVVAVDGSGNVSLANPRAEALLGRTLSPGMSLRNAAPALGPLIDRAARGQFDEDPFEVEIEGRQLNAWTTSLGRGGAVVTLDDVTELARAQRVLAWGEMARQVAHEIKNPLTPIRLGVQHLKRARTDARVDFDKVLNDNVARILAEIDRLDEIARAFSRYGSIPEERATPEPIDVVAVVKDVVGLEQMGASDGVVWSIHETKPRLFGLARQDELKEVLLNILENARHARASQVTLELSDDEAGVLVRISDNGDGIPPDVLPRIFEPHFSTKTSGSGLGLAISRQILDGWGGEIGVESSVGKGTVVSVRLRRPLPESS
jgi:signal transduction histidine kinase